jgi:hypothetical protein
MRRVRYRAAASLDGYVAGPRGTALLEYGVLGGGNPDRA